MPNKLKKKLKENEFYCVGVRKKCSLKPDDMCLTTWKNGVNALVGDCKKFNCTVNKIVKESDVNSLEEKYGRCRMSRRKSAVKKDKSRRKSDAKKSKSRRKSAAKKDKSRRKSDAKKDKCEHGVKKSGECKKKPGRKSDAKKSKSRRKSAAKKDKSRRKSDAKKDKSRRKSAAKKAKCEHGVKKSGECKKKPGRKNN